MYGNKSSNSYIKAVELRKIGKSYSEIHKLLEIPKSTLSSWFSNKDWSQEVKNIRTGRQKGLFSKSLKSASLAIKRLKIERDEEYIKEIE